MSEDNKNQLPPWLPCFFGIVTQIWTPPQISDNNSTQSVYTNNNKWDWDNLPPTPPPMSYAAALASRPPPFPPTPPPQTPPQQQQKKQQQQQRGRNSDSRGGKSSNGKPVQYTSFDQASFPLQILQYCELRDVNAGGVYHVGSNSVLTSLFLSQALNWTTMYASSKFNVVLRKQKFASFNWSPPSPPL